MINLALPTGNAIAVLVTVRFDQPRHLLEVLESQVEELAASSETLTSIRINRRSDGSFGLLIVGDPKVFANNIRERIIDKELAFIYIANHSTEAKR